MVKKIFWGGGIILLAITFSYFFFQPTPSTNELRTHVRVAYLGTIQSLPFYYGYEKGYFADAGIDIEFIQFDSPNRITDSLISGRTDLASASATGINAIAESRNPGTLLFFSLIGGDDSVVNDLLLVPTKSAITDLSELSGKTLGILPGIQFRTIAQQILSQHNLTTDKDVTIVEIAPSIQAQSLASGQIDALLTIEPIGTIVKGNGIGRDLISSPMVRYISSPWYGATSAFRTAFVEEHPDVAQKIVDIYAQSVKEISDDPQTARTFLRTYTALPEDMIALAPLPTYIPVSRIEATDISALQTFLDIFVTYGVIGSVNAKQLLYVPTS